MKNKRALIIGCIVLVVLVAAFGLIYQQMRPASSNPDGTKKFTLEVVLADGSTSTHNITTDAEYLGEALLEESLIVGDASEFGLFVTTVDGITADDSKQEWWALYKDGEMTVTGVDITPVEDGDIFEFRLETW